ncbi:hypothetical protein EV360DRAFT_66231 [Lentinula raphanica]|nr:hypothetical protein EV360DRAFT_66231 [Lentinula raphanica]
MSGDSIPDSTGRKSSTALITTFITIHTFAWTTCLIMIITVFLSPAIHRQSTWVNLNISWIMACFVYAFLLPTGQLYNPDPQFGVCLFQAAAVYAVQSLVAGTMLALSLQVWWNIQRSKAGSPTMSTRHRDAILIIFPYIVPAIELIVIASYAGRNSQKVILTESGMFCGLTTPIPYRNWYQVSGSVGNALATMVRLAMFTLVGIVGVIFDRPWLNRVNILDLINPFDPSIVNILESLPPLAFVFIFGLQQDILRAWTGRFWRNNNDHTTSMSKISTADRSTTRISTECKNKRENAKKYNGYKVQG